MLSIQSVAEFLERFAPTMLAESWDNVGLLVGDREAAVCRIMTCLTITPESVEEALEHEADLLVTHHPLPFHATKRLTTDDTTGSMLLRLIQQKVAIYSPHTAFDSASQGINQQLAEALQLQEITCLVPIPDAPEGTGSGRLGWLRPDRSVGEFADRLKQFLQIDRLQMVGSWDARVSRVAVACGAAGQFLGAARKAGAELLVLGETNFHTCLEARAGGIALLLTGHFWSERFAVENLAQQLSRQFPEVRAWASESETDPITTV